MLPDSLLYISAAYNNKESLLFSISFFVQGPIVAVSRTNPAMLAMIGKALNGIFDKPTDVFMRVKPLDILFRGIMINCARTEFAPKAVCTAFKKEAVSGFEFEPNNQIRFSFFGMVPNLIILVYSFVKEKYISADKFFH